jgi:Holliday junction resolvase RusA-like endonuclease
MPTKRRVDLVNLQESTLDVLVAYGIIADDNSNIVASMDGSRVLYDKQSPRTEIYINKFTDTANSSIIKESQK